MRCRQATLANQAREASLANDLSAIEYHVKNLDSAMSCPLCRAELPCTEQETFEASLKNAKKGKAYAQHAVATKYEAGRGTKKNFNKAAKYFRAAAEQGHPWSMSSYGNLLEKGAGVRKDIGEAKKWYERSAELKQPQGYTHLGNLYENGIGVQKDEAKAARLYRIAAEMGFDIAQCSLGCCYDFGTGLPENPEQALIWYLKSAEQGTNATAMGNASATMLKIASIKYGRCDVVGKSPVPKAIYWGKRAAKLGNEEAAAAVKQIDDLCGGLCANCNKPASSVDLKRCTRCRVIRYCGRDCQREHWKAGHKLDCYKADKG